MNEVAFSLEERPRKSHHLRMSDVEELLNQGLLSQENGVSAENRALLTSKIFSEVVNYKEDTIIYTQGGEPSGSGPRICIIPGKGTSRQTQGS